MFGSAAIPLTAYERGINDLVWAIHPPTTAQRIDGGGEDDTPILLPVITDDKDLDQALDHYFGIRLPNKKCCKNHRTPWEAFHHAFFAIDPIAVWKGSRGFAGKSYTLAGLSLAEGLFLRADVNVLGGSGVQAKRILESMKRLWDHGNAPRRALRGDPGTEKQTFIWGNSIQALMASQKSVRGPHPQRLRMDEIDEMKLDLLDAALGQPMAKGWVQSHTVLSSTHQYPDGTMTEVLKRAKDRGWPFYEWCYRETLEPHGWLSLAEVERKRAVLTVAMWDTEIEGQEPSSEGRAIDTAKVEAAFRADLKLEDPLTIEKADPKGQLVTVVVGVYGTGADWAKKKNFTVIITIRKDVKPMRVVSIERVQREPWPTMAGYLDRRINIYGGTSVHDNTGLGQVVHDLLNHNSEPFDMVGRQRAELLSEYVAAIEQGDLLWPRADDNDKTPAGLALLAAYGEHKYATREDLYKGSKDGSSKYHLPDTISAGALAWRAASQAVAAGVTQPPPNQNISRLNDLTAVTERMRANRQAGQLPASATPTKEATDPEPEAPAIDRDVFKRPNRKPDPA